MLLCLTGNHLWLATCPVPLFCCGFCNGSKVAYIVAHADRHNLTLATVMIIIRVAYRLPLISLLLSEAQVCRTKQWVGGQAYKTYTHGLVG